MDFNFEITDSILNIRPSALEDDYDDNPLLPAVPYLAYRILRPSASSSIKFDLEVDKELIYENVYLRANPSIFLDESEGGNNNIASLSTQSPIECFGVKSRYGYKYAYLRITPFIYDVESKRLYFIKQLHILIDDDYTSDVRNNLCAEEDRRDDIAAMVYNPEEIDTFYPIVKNTAKKLLSTQPQEIIDYVIITNPLFVSHFKDLADWKTRKGLKTRIVSTTDIYQNAEDPSESVYLKIKRFIYDMYSNHGTKWVLLGGDACCVPSQYCPASYNAEDGSYEGIVNTDLYYACFHGAFDWDARPNGIIAEMQDDVDMSPDIYITRAPVHTASDVQAFTEKVIKYEQQTVSPQYPGKLLFFGVKSGKNYLDLQYSNDSITNAHWFNEEIFRRFGGSCSHHYLYETGCNISGVSEVSKKTLFALINCGYPLLHFSNHGDAGHIFFPKGLSYTPTDAYSLTNQYPIVLVSTTCMINDFRSSDKMGSCLMNSSHFAVASYASSQRSVLRYPGNFSHSALYDGYFLKYALQGCGSESLRNFGAVAAETKKQLADKAEIKEKDGYRYLQLAIAPLGDPEMPLYITAPQQFSGVSVTKSGNSVTVSVGNNNNSTIALVSTDLETYIQKASKVGSHTFYNVPSSFFVTITADNFKPYVSDTLFIFNNIVGNTCTCGDDIYEIDNLPSECNVEWSFKNNPALDGLITQNYPVAGQCRIANVANIDQSDDILVANIKKYGQFVAQRTKYVRFKSYVYGTYKLTTSSGIDFSNWQSFSDKDVIPIMTDYNLKLKSGFFNIPTMTYSFDGVVPSYTFDDSQTLSLMYSSDGYGIISKIVGSANNNNPCLNFQLYIRSLGLAMAPQTITIESDVKGETISITMMGDAVETKGWDVVVSNAASMQNVYRAHMQENTLLIDTKSWAKGLYVVTTSCGDSTQSKKIIVK